MKAMRPMTAVLAAAVVTAVSALLTQLLQNAGEALPQHSWWELLVVLVLCAALMAAGWRVRDEVRSRTRAKREADAALRSGADEEDARAAAAAVMRAREAVPADTARRVVVLSQAGAVGGGVLFGWYAGQALAQLERVSVPSVRSAVILLACLAAAAVVLSVCGFVVQRWCTIPDDER